MLYRMHILSAGLIVLPLGLHCIMQRELAKIGLGVPVMPTHLNNMLPSSVMLVASMPVVLIYEVGGIAAVRSAGG
jgi:hypothetical protein